MNHIAPSLAGLLTTFAMIICLWLFLQGIELIISKIVDWKTHRIDWRARYFAEKQAHIETQARLKDALKQIHTLEFNFGLNQRKFSVIRNPLE